MLVFHADLGAQWGRDYRLSCSILVPRYSVSVDDVRPARSTLYSGKDASTTRTKQEPIEVQIGVALVDQNGSVEWISKDPAILGASDDLDSPFVLSRSGLLYLCEVATQTYKLFYALCIVFLPSPIMSYYYNLSRRHTYARGHDSLYNFSTTTEMLLVPADFPSGRAATLRFRSSCTDVSGERSHHPAICATTSLPSDSAIELAYLGSTKLVYLWGPVHSIDRKQWIHLLSPSPLLPSSSLALGISTFSAPLQNPDRGLKPFGRPLPSFPTLDTCNALEVIDEHRSQELSVRCNV
ncbi:hypothetical protein EW145_g6798 [Phellinidium pouzarii]|uniref:Uncharacterized protein n=1 Tax=Phellinidium pouzarii TaxID=167371 RepID=A0A4S4KTV2_9AGAM|nr:hypothetical protein EW145_g6798 [Phellinidium pouzarii]